ncbi:LysR family transcriptional regulator [Salipiger sp. P9]|uniref:LysR family transcriptional regulator n=1 Tax=Salipiger pentaromativorans TaxID=2943193 RepID=UPI0021586222|nr:LysR family transcriptional regulator [Salipiger pentaromativorans]MCR8548003.1 LysR family transcriptional regulator [Salipiger pentaromativorans]
MTRTALSGAQVDELMAFLAVVEAGSFVAGGQSLGLSRSAAGKAVARLEAHFGTRLLRRTTRALSLTEDGRRLHAQALALRETLDSIGGELTTGAGDPRGELRISAPDALGRRLVLPVVQRFLDRWPQVQVEMSLSDRVTDMVTDGTDLAIRIGVSTPNPGLICRTLRREPLVLCASPAYLARTDPPTRVEHLSRHDLLIHSHQRARLTWQMQERDGTWMRVAGRSRLRMDSGEALREAALAGMGLALLPASLVRRDLGLDHLRQVLPDHDAGSVEIMALYPHRRLLDAKVRQFVDLLATELAP